MCSTTENWFNCAADCAPTCGNGVCECSDTGEWGGQVCCFPGYEGASWRDPFANERMDCTATAIGGPETRESCPFDCGVPCPPFCDGAETCADGTRLFPTEATQHEVNYREHTLTDAWGHSHSEPAAPWESHSVDGTGVTSTTLSNLLPEITYDVRVRALNAAGAGPWSQPTPLTTSGLPGGGECMHDDQQCVNVGKIQTVTYLHAGLGCTSAPPVVLLGGNCAVNATNGTAGCIGNPGGRTAEARAIIADGMVVDFEMLDGGSNYSEAPTVVVTSPNCTLQASAFATIDAVAGVVTKVGVVPACVTPGGNWQDRDSRRNDRAINGLSGDDFASVRETMPYAAHASCAWRIAPPVPEGYTLRVSVEHFNTEPGADVVRLFDGYPPVDDQGRTFESKHWPWSLRVERELPYEVKQLPRLFRDSGTRDVPKHFAPKSNEALLTFHSDESIQEPGGFKVSWGIQPLQPPEQPLPPTALDDSITTDSLRVRWAMPSSTLPVETFLLQVWPHADAAQKVEYEFTSQLRAFTLLRLHAGTTYTARVQAWTAAVAHDVCTAGENYVCSQWSRPTNVTTQVSATTWFVAPSGSYLYGNGSIAAPFAMDLQGLIDSDRTKNGHEIVLMPGTYGTALLRGPGSAQNLVLNSKLVNIRSHTSAIETIVDCGGTSRFLTYNASEPASVVLRGLTLRNCGGGADGRGAIYFTNSSSPTISELVFAGNIAERGAAFVADGEAAPSFLNCSFIGNRAQSGCSELCMDAMLTDDACSNACNTRECGWDYRGSCCSATCGLAWADGVADAACNISACAYDGGDACDDATCTDTRGDGTCDVACDVASCGFDGGDCTTDAGLSWGGFDLSEQLGFDGRAKGGVGLVSGGASVLLSGCDFTDNAAGLGGAFYVQGCLVDREADAPCPSSVMDAGGTSVLELRDCSASSNRAAEDGGLVYAAIGARVVISRLVAHNNSAGGGGGLLAAYRSTVTVDAAEVDAHAAAIGGALHLSDSDATITQSTVRDTLALDAGGALHVTDGSVVSLTSCRIEASRAARGGAVSVVSSATAPHGSGLLATYSLSEPPQLTIDACELSNNTATESGGAIDARGIDSLAATVSMSSSTLVGNRVENGTGGAIAVRLGALYVDSSVLASCRANASGGGVYSEASTLSLVNATLASNSAGDRGGAVRADAGSLDIVESMLHDNVADGADGGGALALSAVTTSLARVTLERNSAPRGGAVAASAGAAVGCIMCTLNENFAGKGGAMYATAATLTLTSSLAERNRAVTAGGALCAVDASTVEMESSTARANKCTEGNGGAVMLERSMLSVTSSHFDHNIASLGGAIHVEGTAVGAALSVTHTMFESNAAVLKSGDALETQAEGGAIYLYSAGTFELEDSYLRNNSARSGGGLSVVASTSLLLARSNLTNNSASESGGACSVTLGSLDSEDSSYNGNSAASLGGVAYLLSSQGTFTRDSLVANSAGTDGGALALGGSQASIEDCSFRANEAAGLGGGGALLSQSTASVDASTFEANRALSGGGLSVEAASLDATESVFIRNVATENGGGIYAKGAFRLQLDDLSFVDNSANQGGGLYVRESSPVLTRLHVTGNRAATAPGLANAIGGGVALVSCMSASLADSHICDNRANESAASLALAAGEQEDTISEVLAGGMYCRESHMSLENMTFCNNLVFGADEMRGRGAGIAAFSCSATMELVSFDENVADEAGGVLWRGFSPLRLTDSSFTANMARRNPNSAALQWGSESSGGEASGGGLLLEGCTRFSDGFGNQLHLLDASIVESCTPAASRRSLGDASVAEKRRRGRRLFSLAQFGVSTPVSRLAWAESDDAPHGWAESDEATSGEYFPNVTLVYALDAYNNTVPTATGTVVASPGSLDAICDVCVATAELVEGVATFDKLGLTTLPGSVGELVFSSTKGAPSPPMHVTMKQCEPGEYIDVVSRVCRLCLAGSYANASGAAVCIDCFLGTFAAGDGATACASCASGSVATLRGRTVCDECDAGTASAVDGTECVQCSPGEYQDRDGSPSCVACPSGSQAPAAAATSCSPCSGGTHSIEARTGCTQCVAGYAQDREGSSSCDQCALGLFAAAPASTSCETCSAGSKGQVDRTGCDACPAGQYQSSAGASSCEFCGVGTYSASASSTECTACPTGKRARANETERTDCAACSPGTYQAITGSSACTVCDIGKYSVGSGYESCAECQAGSHGSAEDRTQCFSCAPGSFNPLPAAVGCLPCGDGHFASTPGAQACTQCEPGKHSRGANESRLDCVACEPGFHQALPASSACERCPDGAYSATSGAAACVSCEAGKHGVGDGGVRDSCTSCLPGTYQPLPGTLSCLVCPVGTMAPAGGAESCMACAAGSHGVDSRIECEQCATGRFAPGAGSSSCTDCIPGEYQPNRGQTACAKCLERTYSIGGTEECTPCHEGANCSFGEFHGSNQEWWSGVLLMPTMEAGRDEPDDRFHECKPINGLKPDRCLGGFNSECVRGYTGPLCSLCWAEWFKARASCEPCNEDDVLPSNSSGEAGSGDTEAQTVLGMDVEAYDADTHRVHYDIHVPIGFIAASIIVGIVLLLWVAQRDPLAAKPKKEKKPSRLRGLVMRTRLGRKFVKVLDARMERAEANIDPLSRASLDAEQSLVRRCKLAHAPTPSATTDGKKHVSLDMPVEERVAALKLEGKQTPAAMRAALTKSAPTPPPSPPSGFPSPPPSPPTEEGTAPSGGMTSRLLKDMKGLGVGSEAPTGVVEALGDIIQGTKEQLKILITHFQISTSFRFNLDVDYPWETPAKIREYFDWVNLDLTEFAKLECVKPINFYDRLFGTVFTASLMLIAIPLTCLALNAVQSGQWHFKPKTKTPAAQRIRFAFVNRCWYFFLFLSFFFFPVVSKRIFNTLICSELEPGKLYLWADLSLVCEGAEYEFWSGFAWASMAIYTCGIPLFFWFILYYNHRKLVLQTPRCQARYGFLYSKYEDRAWYWELIEMFRKLMCPQTSNRALNAPLLR